MLFRVALLAVDEASIHPNSEKVKLKMKKKMKIFSGVTVSNCRHLILHFSGLYIFQTLSRLTNV